MAVVNKFLSLIGLEPDDEEYEMEEEEMVQPERSYAKVQGGLNQPLSNVDEISAYSKRTSRTTNTTNSRDNKVINMHKSVANNNNNLIIFKPTCCDDSSQMIDSLKDNRPIIANFENVDHENAQRILDIICGAMYAMNGSVHKVSKNIYVFAPENLDVSGESRENRGNNSISSLYMDFNK